MSVFRKALFLSCCVSSVFAANTVGVHPTMFKPCEGDRMQTQQEESIKSGGVVDYRGSRISDLKTSNTVSVLSVLSDIREAILNSPFNPTNVTVNLSENYITSLGFKQLVGFFVADDNQVFASKIKHLNLTNNRINREARENILLLLKQYPNLSLDLSINYLALSELGDMGEIDETRISVRTY